MVAWSWLDCLQHKELLSMLVSDDLPFEFKALELVLELSCLSLDAQV